MALFFAGASALLTACSSPLSTHDGLVTVVDGSGLPIAGATVRVDAVDPHHPLNVSDYFRGEPSCLGVWKTGPDGRANVELLTARPTQLSILASGFFPSSRFLEPGQQAAVVVELAPVQVESGNPR